MSAAATWFDTAGMVDTDYSAVVARLVELASHSKWEVRRAVAAAAGRSRHSDFSRPLVVLEADENGQVRNAAQKASLRRRDWANLSVFGAQHEVHLNNVLDQLDAKLGPRARVAVRKTADELNAVFVREIYHELIKVLDPQAKSASRVIELLPTQDEESPLGTEAKRVRLRVARLAG